MDVQGKTAIITGGGSGINLAFAKLLLSKSCNVIIADIALTAEASTLLADHHPHAKVVFKHTDVANWRHLETLFPFALEQGFGVPDIVVPGAGIFEPEWSNFFHGEKSAEAEAASRYRTIDVNLVHPIRLTRLAVRAFLAARKERAAVVHVSSVSGQLSTLGAPIYTATKHGLSGFVRSLGGLESAFGVRVSAVAPGIIKTPLWLDHPEKLLMVDEKQDKWATPEEVADAMLRLVESPELPGGTILEVGAGCTRLVTELNDPGPQGEGFSLANGHLLGEQAIEVLKVERDRAWEAEGQRG